MIYNGFMFFDEFDMLDIRLNELWDTVDKFILVECPTTHRGKEKKLFFDERKHDYGEYSEKLIHIIHDLPNDKDAWVNENEHRRGIMRAINMMWGNDYLIITDADEIPRAEAIKSFNGNIGALQMDFFYYKYNLKNKSTWDVAKMVRLGAMTEDINYYRQNVPGSELIPNAGWHFSKVYSLENMKYMFKNCLADDLYHDSIVDNLEEWSKEGVTQWCGHRNEFFQCEIDSSYPKWFVENIERFKDYIK